MYYNLNVNSNDTGEYILCENTSTIPGKSGENIVSATSFPSDYSEK